MNKTTKAKINLNEGVIELEGSEEFVQKNLDEFKTLIKFESKEIHKNKNSEISNKEDTKKINKKSHKRIKKGVNIIPIPLDFKSSSKTLKDFFKEKFPKGSQSNQEITTLFVYYLNKTLSILDVLPGHIVSCYNEISLKKPLNIPQLFRDITSLKGWIEPSATSGSVKITISGDNLMQHDLPRENKSIEK